MSAPTAPRSRPGARPRPDAGPRASSSSVGESVADGLAGALAAVQALALSLAVVVLPALVAYLVATASGTAAGDGQVWRTPLEIGAGIWLLGHGVPVTASGATFTLVPLGLTALALFACHVSARHAARARPRAWIVATVCYAAGATAVAVAVPSVTAWTVLAAPVAGAVVGGLGFGAGMLTRGGSPSPAELGERLDRLVRGWFPATLRLGARAGLVGTTLLVGVAALLVGAWAVAGRSTSSDIIRALDPGWAGGIVLAVAQLALLPDLVLWATGWLSGAGFSVGSGTSFTPFGVDAGPLPGVPLLAALPGPDWTGGLALAAPLVVVACGAVAGGFAWRRLEPGRLRWPDVAFVLGGLAGTAGLLVGALQAAASGAVGAARLADVGATPWLAALLTAGELLLGAAVAFLPPYLTGRYGNGAGAPGT
ncbi:DUF6350 family protein [Myceligenerans xiligouense]|uniref:Uncharacterized protein n=1 Tax=Myceligenerans xiligouense TaxID=253184 RepID=A0A3N4YTP3_9MICO|nr:DUF6350 family protein [Myceligenerans xiligouense]RPF22744.1 hypothetical protein EDD34_3416 [Myceligenerans xiligouense]